MKRFSYFMLFAVLSILLICPGCASKKHVNKGFKNVDGALRNIENSVEENQTRISENERVIKDHDGRIIKISEETQAALNRINSVEKMAMGKLLYQITLDNDNVKFKLGDAQLSDSGKLIIDEMIDLLISQNKNVFIEIQGHTDSTGGEGYNYKLGLERAESVRRYLSEKGIPLHRMSVISYGETKPVADNSTSEGRSQNRRVIILVLE